MVASLQQTDSKNYFPSSRKNSYSGSRKGSAYEVPENINIQPQINMALSVAENLTGKSPSLRKVSVNSEQQPKSGVFGRKKAAEQSLVFTFSSDDSENGIVRDSQLEETDTASVFSDESRKNLKADSVINNMKQESVVSFRTTNTQASNMEEELEILRKHRFFDFLTMVLSISYGILIVISSLGIYCSDLFFTNSYQYNNSEIWNLCLSSLGIILLLWLAIDIQMYIKTINKMGASSSFFDKLKLVEGADGELCIELPLNKGRKKNVPEYYAFTTGRHAGSFFLKIGAAVFCFGHLIHMGLNFVKHIYSMTDDDAMIEKLCGQKEGLAYDIIYPLFSLVQLYFVFKFGNVIVNKNKWLARLTFMHCLSSSLSFWMNTLINETLDAIVKKKYFIKKLSDCPGDQTAFSIKANEPEEVTPCIREMTGSTTNNLMCSIETRAMCNNGEHAEELFALAPWFYPFSIEFCVLIAGVWFILWSSIGQVHHYKNEVEFLPSVTPQGSMENIRRTEGHKQAMILFADCSSSNRGLLFGVILTVLVLVTSIFVIIKEGDCNPNLGITVGNILKITVLSIILIATVYAYYVLAHFDVNLECISLLDDMLLFFCLPSFFLYALISLGPSLMMTFEPEYFVTNVLTLIQVLIQTPMIVDGLRRCSNSARAQKKMKGRNVITFLIVANLAIYLMETLMIKSYDYQTMKSDFYGPEAWTVLSHMTLPICIFYRFHSAVALVDIWNSAYKPSGHS